MHFTASDVLSGLPAEWQAKMAENEFIPVKSGMSGAYVFRIPDRQAGDQYLKVGIGTNADQLRREGARTKWLASVGLRVPEVIMQFDGTNLFAMRMAALGGQSAVFISPDNWRPVANAIAHAFAAMHSLPTDSCPFDETLHVRLARARELIRRGEIDAAQFDARNAGITPAELYRRLEAGIPAQEDCVVTHGDATLSNLIFGNDGKIGFVDCGNCGKADRYVDLALLFAELADRFGSPARNFFLETYGRLHWDMQKVDFYSDLYELF
jgi:aminoglycoside phosphotransferase